MTKKIKICLLLIFTLIISACSKTNPEELNELILTPETDKPVLAGTWQVSDIEEITASNNEYPKIGDKLYISKNLVAFNDEYAFPPTFTSKYVNLEDYLINRGYDFENIDKNENVVVVDTSQGQYFARNFVQRSPDEIFFIANDKIIYLSRLSDTVDDEIVDKYAKLASKERSQSENQKDLMDDTSILIGVRERTDLSNNQQDYNYYTYLLNIKNDGDISYGKAPDIFLRGQDEYWKVRSIKNKFSGLYDNIESFPVRLEDSMDKQENSEKYSFLDFDMNIKINYVDLDYISFSYLSSLSDNTISKYGVVSTKDLEENNLIKIDEFTGENDAYDQLKNMVINDASSKTADFNTDDLVIEEDNFGIVRDYGSWVIQTSIYTKDSQKKASSQIPIRNYLEERVNVNSDIDKDQVKNINSQAKDYFIIGNDNYILIQTADEILVHKIIDNEIEKNPIFSISTPNPTGIVSFDQQLGSSAELLENTFKNSNVLVESDHLY